MQTSNLENLLIRINEGVRINIDSIKTRVKNLVSKMEARIKPLINNIAPIKKTLSLIKT